MIQIGTKIVEKKRAGKTGKPDPACSILNQPCFEFVEHLKKEKKVAQPMLHTRTILNRLSIFVVNNMLNLKKLGGKKMETRKKNWKLEQEKIVRAFMKAYGISQIHEIGSEVFPEALSIYGMRYTGTINKETYVNCEGTGLIGNELCDEYTAKRGDKYWYVFDLAPFWGEPYTVFETKKPRFEKILKHTIDAYEMLLDVLRSSEEELKRFWKIEVDEETPWDAMRVRMWKFLHPINV